MLTYSKGGAPLGCRWLRLRPSPQRGQRWLPDHSQQEISLGVPSLLPHVAITGGRGDGPTAVADPADPADAAIVVRVPSHSRVVTGGPRWSDRRFCAAILLLQNWGLPSLCRGFTAILLLDLLLLLS